MNHITMAHHFAVTLPILPSFVTVQTVALVELQGEDLIPKGSAAVHFKGLAGGSTLLLTLPRLMTMQLAIESVELSEIEILITAQFFYVTLLLEENKPYDPVTDIYLTPRLDMVHSMGKVGMN